ncbi:MAG TPA: alpha/beta hydrolase [Gemmatimonadaceae bacterium]|nr:alpha/beta hydrolase [Gemmatimonadaceae bacterium]
MKRERFTVPGIFRLAAALLLFLFSLLILFPAPTYTLWMVEIAAAERGHYTALVALALLIPGWRRGRLSLISWAFALAALAIAVTPLVRAYRIGSGLPGKLDAAFGRPPGQSLQIAAANEQPVSLRALVDTEETPGVARTTLGYASRTSGVLQLDMYRSQALTTPLPLVVVIHGGSWSGGSRADLPELNHHLAARGYAVAAVSYRFAPRFPNPAATDDVNAAIDFLKANADRLVLDASRIALIGRSAGGHLALLSAYTKQDSAIRGVVAFYPPTDQRFGYNNPSKVIKSQRILRSYLSGTPVTRPEAYDSTSPIKFVSPQTVPTLLIHGTKDELVSVRQSRMLDVRLEQERRPHLLVELPWATHGCDFGFTGPCGQISTYAVDRFLAAVMQ